MRTGIMNVSVHHWPLAAAVTLSIHLLAAVAVLGPVTVAFAHGGDANAIHGCITRFTKLGSVKK